MIRSEELGQMLQDLRLLRGLELDDCARQAGISQVLLFAAEAGEISEDALETLARYFGVEPGALRGRTLVREEEAPGATIFLKHGPSTDFRATDLPALERALRIARKTFAEARDDVARAMTRRRLFAPVPVAGPRAVHAARQGHRLARRVRGSLGLGTEPILDMCAWMEVQMGVVVTTERLASRDLRACAIVDAGQGPVAMIVTPDESFDGPPQRRARGWLAHELCHVLFDQTTEGAVRIDLDVRDSGMEVALTESRANGFAAEFMVPFAGVRDLLGARRMGASDIQTARTMVEQVSDHFCAPWQMTAYHLKNLGYLMEAVAYRLIESSDARTSVPPRRSMPTTPIEGAQQSERFPRAGAGSLRFGAAESDERVAPRHAARAWEVMRHSPVSGDGQVIPVSIDIAVEAWTTLRDEGATSATRVAALGELVMEGDDGLPQWLASELERDDLDPPWRDAVIAAVEQTQVTDPALRARFVTSLLAAARSLQGPAQWSALRRYASMVPVAACGSLLEFLAIERETGTIQVALQCIANVFEVERADDRAVCEALRAAVRAVAAERIVPSRVQGAEDVALCFNCFIAALALREPSVDDMLKRLEALGHRRLTERAQQALARMRSAPLGGG